MTTLESENLLTNLREIDKETDWNIVAKGIVLERQINVHAELRRAILKTEASINAAKNNNVMEFQSLS